MEGSICGKGVLEYVTEATGASQPSLIAMLQWDNSNVIGWQDKIYVSVRIFLALRVMSCSHAVSSPVLSLICQSVTHVSCFMAQSIGYAYCPKRSANPQKSDLAAHVLHSAVLGSPSAPPPAELTWNLGLDLLEVQTSQRLATQAMFANRLEEEEDSLTCHGVFS